MIKVDRDIALLTQLDTRDARGRAPFTAVLRLPEQLPPAVRQVMGVSGP